MANTDRALAARFTDGDEGQQRCKDTQSPPPFLGLVDRTISPSSAKFQSQKGRDAIEEEIRNLRKECTWGECSVSEWSEVRHVKKRFRTYVRLVFYYHGSK